MDEASIIIISNLGTHIKTLKSHLRNSHQSIFNTVIMAKRQERKVLDALRSSDNKRIKQWNIDMNTLVVSD